MTGIGNDMTILFTMDAYLCTYANENITVTKVMKIITQNATATMQCIVDSTKTCG